MPVYIDETRLENAATDVDSLAVFVNGSPTAGVDGVITTRLGTNLKVLSKITEESTAGLAALESDTADALDALTAATQADIDAMETDVADFLSGATTISQGKELRGQNATASTSYTFVLDDAGKNVRFTSATTITAYVPANATTAFPVNTVIYISQGSTGPITVVGAGGVTVNNPNPLTGTAKGQWRALVKISTDEWDLI
jgi:hypothetical protein